MVSSTSRASATASSGETRAEDPHARSQVRARGHADRRGPSRHFLDVDCVVFGKRRERREAAVIWVEPSLPVRAGDVADVGSAAVGLYPQQLLEIDRRALGLEFLGAFLGGIPTTPFATTAFPSAPCKLSPTAGVAHDRRRIAGIDARQKRHARERPKSGERPDTAAQ